jgi:hypothetical protein
MLPTARAAFGLPARLATSVYDKVFPLGIFRTTSLTFSAKVFDGFFNFIGSFYHSGNFSSN